MSSHLIIDTSTSHCAIALRTLDGLFEVVDDTPRSHAVKLLPNISALLNEHGVTLPALETIAVVTGPGSFTGLRIGVGVAQGLAEAAAIDVISLSSLQAQAFAGLNNMTNTEAIELGSVANGANTVDPVSILVAVQARSDEVYYASYAAVPSQGHSVVIPQLVGKEAVAKITDVRFAVDSTAIILAGSGWAHRNALTQADESLRRMLALAEPSLDSSPYTMAQLSTLTDALRKESPPSQDALVLPNYVQNQMPYNQAPVAKETAASNDRNPT